MRIKTRTGPSGVPATITPEDIHDRRAASVTVGG